MQLLQTDYDNLFVICLQLIEKQRKILLYSSYDKILLPITASSIIVLVIIVWFFLRKSSVRFKQIPCIVVIATMIIFEVVKIIVLRGDAETNKRLIPLYISSTPLYFYTIAVVFNNINYRISQIGFALSITVGTCIGLGTYVVPSWIIGNASRDIIKGVASFSQWHSYFYHQVLIFFVLFVVAFKLYNPNKKDCKWILFGIATMLLVILIASYTIGPDYARFKEFPLTIFDNLRGEHPALTAFIMYLFYQAIGLMGVLINFVIPVLFLKVKKYILAKFNSKNDGTQVVLLASSKSQQNGDLETQTDIENSNTQETNE